MDRPTQRNIPVVIDPTEGASQIGYREISGDLPSTGERLLLKTWAIVFDLQPQANYRYQLLRDLLESVNSKGLAAVRLDGVAADRLGSLSERTDSLGQVTTIWVTALTDDDTARGAILVALSDVVVHLLAVPPYKAEGNERGVYLLEGIATNMDVRLENLRLPAWSDTMSRLPILGDVSDALLNTRVGINTYTARH